MQPIRLIALAAPGSSIALGHGLTPALAQRMDTTTNVEFPAGSSAKRLSEKIKGEEREMHNGDRWCRVQLRDDPRVEGWARGQYLREFKR